MENLTVDDSLNSVFHSFPTGVTREHSPGVSYLYANFDRLLYFCVKVLESSAANYGNTDLPCKHE